MKINVSKKEYQYILDLMEGQAYELGDNNEWNTPKGKMYTRVHTKLIKAFNKTGHYYLWQLINRDGEVTPENIKMEWIT